MKAPPRFSDWLAEYVDRQGSSRSGIYKAYIRAGGERSNKTFHNWCNGESTPGVEDAARLVKALELEFPGESIRASFEQFLGSFDRSPRRDRGVVPLPDGVPHDRHRLTA